jgi:hypothetical protein
MCSTLLNLQRAAAIQIVSSSHRLQQGAYHSPTPRGRRSAAIMGFRLSHVPAASGTQAAQTCLMVWNYGRLAPSRYYTDQLHHSTVFVGQHVAMQNEGPCEIHEPVSYLDVS